MRPTEMLRFDMGADVNSQGVPRGIKHDIRHRTSPITKVYTPKYVPLPP